MKINKVVTVNCTPAEAYAFWRQFENFPRFMRHLESVHVRESGTSHWKAKAPLGKTVEWDAEVIEDVPNEVIAWRSLEGGGIQNAGSVRFGTATGNRGTVVRVHLEYSPPAGAVGAFIAKLFGEEPEQQLDDDVRAFKQVMECGEVTLSDATLTGMRTHRRPAQPPEVWPLPGALITPEPMMNELQAAGVNTDDFQPAATNESGSGGGVLAAGASDLDVIDRGVPAQGANHAGLQPGGENR